MQEKFYFKGLNGIRAIAATLVVLFHIDQFLYRFGISSLGYHQTGMAAYAVVLFFVLSGFLITYLLLLEKEKNLKINFKMFYLRRILRIWPIYYITIIFCFVFVITNTLEYSPTTTPITFILYSLLLSNIGYSIGLGLTPITPLWSVGVEEQFYLFWPTLINTKKNIFYNMLYFIIFFLVMKFSFYLLNKFNIQYGALLYNLISNSSFDCMAIGGIAAWAVYKKLPILTFFYSRILQFFAWSFFVISIFYKPVHLFSFIDFEMHAIIYAIIILNVATNPNSLVNLENKLMNYIGRISYGIYVYHMTIIFLLSLIFNKNLLNNSILNYVVIYCLVIVLTLIVSHFSYNYFEIYFLKYKERFSTIKSTNNNPI